ncbi:hypothetical protein ACLB1N_22405 [Escherichia coli]
MLKASRSWRCNPRRHPLERPTRGKAQRKRPGAGITLQMMSCISTGRILDATARAACAAPKRCNAYASHHLLVVECQPVDLPWYAGEDKPHRRERLSWRMGRALTRRSSSTRRRSVRAHCVMKVYQR